MPETYIVRFKVLKVESAALRDGRQYTVAYRRGETVRSSPCYIAGGGVVDFSLMPEGAAIVHFKSGAPRFMPKWITFRLEEYMRGQPRKVIGETQVDCAELLGLHSITASAQRQMEFEINGTSAQMVVALLVYPEKHPPLSFRGVVPAIANDAQSGGAKNDGVKRMTRGEAMTLLISLEAMLERRREGNPKKEDASPLERRLAELEERRRSLSSVDGMAAAVVKQRVEGVVGAQFLALSRKYRDNYVGEVAAYLRQCAVTSGLSLTTDISEEAVTDTEGARERLQRINTRIDDLMSQVRTLEEEQKSLARMQSRADVTNELCAILNKVETLQSQINLLLKTRTALEDVIRGKGMDATPVGREVQEIRQRLRTLTAEETQLQEQVRRMMNVTVTHVLKWARGKNPPTEDLSSDVATLFATGPSQAQWQKTSSKELSAEERRQLVEALSNVTKPLSPPEKPEASSKAEGTAMPPMKELFGAKGLPSVGDFGASASKEKEDAPTSSQGTKTAEKHLDPFIPDLKSDMFAPTLAEGQERNKATLPEFDFGATLDRDAGAELAMGSGSSGAYAMFSNDTHESALVPTAPPVEDLIAIDDDPMYEFRPTAKDTGTIPLTIEFEDSSFFNNLEGEAAAKGPALTFELGSHHSRNSNSGNSQLPTYSFGPDGAAKGGRTTDHSGLPKYDFGT
ncbi:hypothetical protein TraAM80_03053 [Trypanosoma rangeli]|uniref:C2 NT-type domain-containing protein n=1 Tax=Trypanosoma rangeli TaxID=5698 RepID=A0A422NRU0_TRYRA|nr:uncharacterized protein TraAM80_03053 [Trypanosoma rangeli]RNF08197.1 hypothetical protein TraAM80_03053 [Trypanosoma rangeli]|eukprot:RNF08197.1 hypothetical protein TraAM80_03053 [Trypanosoma rangeli]